MRGDRSNDPHGSEDRRSDAEPATPGAGSARPDADRETAEDDLRATAIRSGPTPAVWPRSRTTRAPSRSTIRNSTGCPTRRWSSRPGSHARLAPSAS
jgi:hypothetical protein